MIVHSNFNPLGGIRIVDERRKSGEKETEKRKRETGEELQQSACVKVTGVFASRWRFK